MQQRLRSAILPLGLVLWLGATACSSDSTSPADHGEPPSLPPATSMQADLSLFDAAGAQDVVGSPAVVGSNFLAAAVSVSLARAATIVVMAVPVATFAAAASNTPVYENGAFHWTYNVSENGQQFQADLSGSAQASQSLWEMRISSTATTPPLSDFLWYSGTASLDGTAGAWHIYDGTQPSSGTALLGITWTHVSATDWSVEFTNVNPSAVQVGDKLTYGSSGDLRTVQFLDASASAQTTVEWNDVSHTGSILSPGFNGGVRGCWDATFQDVACNQ